MGSGLYSHTTRSSGTVLTASIYNSDHQNHITNHNTEQMDDYSASVAEMRTQTDPGESGTESQATNLAEELERLRYTIAELKNTTYWYETVKLARSVRSVTGTDDIELTDERATIYADASGGAFTLTGTSAAIAKARFEVEIQNIGSSGVVTIATEGSETINGLSSIKLPLQYARVTLRSDGSNLFISEIFPQPFCSITTGSAQSINTATETLVDFSSVVSDPWGIADTANDRVLPVMPGYYQAEAHVGFTDVLSDGSLFDIYIKKGSTYLSNTRHHVASSNLMICMSSVFNVSMNGTTDALVVNVWQNTGSAKALYNGTYHDCHFNIRRQG